MKLFEWMQQQYGTDADKVRLTRWKHRVAKINREFHHQLSNELYIHYDKANQRKRILSKSATPHLF